MSTSTCTGQPEHVILNIDLRLLKKGKGKDNIVLHSGDFTFYFADTPMTFPPGSTVRLIGLTGDMKFDNGRKADYPTTIFLCCDLCQSIPVASPNFSGYTTMPVLDHLSKTDDGELERCGAACPITTKNAQTLRLYFSNSDGEIISFKKVQLILTLEFCYPDGDNCKSQIETL